MNSTKHINETLGAVVVLSIAFFVVLAFKPDLKTYESPLQTAQNSGAEDSAEEVKKVKSVYWNSHVRIISEIDDSSFISFALNELQQTCPFYEPDGATYRECLYDYVDSKKLETGATVSQVEAFSDYCLSIFTKYKDTLAGIELYQSCMAYKLSI